MSDNIKIAAITAIAAIEIMALYMGLNGVMLAASVGAIAGIAGFVIGKAKK